MFACRRAEHEDADPVIIEIWNDWKLITSDNHYVTVAFLIRFYDIIFAKIRIITLPLIVLGQFKLKW